MKLIDRLKRIFDLILYIYIKIVIDLYINKKLTLDRLLGMLFLSHMLPNAIRTSHKYR
jgi:hypothetical protein